MANGYKNSYPCHCSAYPFPHREYGGKCNGPQEEDDYMMVDEDGDSKPRPCFCCRRAPCRCDYYEAQIEDARESRDMKDTSHYPP